MARDGVEAEVKGLSLARHAAESEGAAARGRAAGLEAACEAQASQIEMLTAHLTAARHRRVRPTQYVQALQLLLPMHAIPEAGLDPCIMTYMYINNPFLIG